MSTWCTSFQRWVSPKWWVSSAVYGWDSHWSQWLIIPFSSYAIVGLRISVVVFQLKNKLFLNNSSNANDRLECVSYNNFLIFLVRLFQLLSASKTRRTITWRRTSKTFPMDVNVLCGSLRYVTKFSKLLVERHGDYIYSILAVSCIYKAACFTCAACCLYTGALAISVDTSAYLMYRTSVVVHQGNLSSLEFPALTIYVTNKRKCTWNNVTSSLDPYLVSFLHHVHKRVQPIIL